MALSPEAEERLTAKLRDALTGPLAPAEVAEGRARWESVRADRAAGGDTASPGPLRAWSAPPEPSQDAGTAPRPAARPPAAKKRSRTSRVA